MSIKGFLLAALTTALMAGSAAATTVSVVFGPGYNYDDGAGALDFSLTGLNPLISGDLSIAFSVIGDLDRNNERFWLDVDGTNFGRGCDNNTGNDTFGIPGDSCSQSNDIFRDGVLLIDNATALGILADGQIDIRFRFNRQVNDIVAITTGPVVRSGATFTNQNNMSFGVGGTVSYSTVPVPAALGFGLVSVMSLLLIGRRKS